MFMTKNKTVFQGLTTSTTWQNDTICQKSCTGIIFRMRELLPQVLHPIKLANDLVQKGNTFLLVAQFFLCYVLEESE